jgi:3-phenylpropionate/trans-cinnamate dioxygenase ferredoxin subunit
METERSENTRWLFACAVGEVEAEDALRIDLEGTAYAIFHTTSGFYASEALCTHEKANLADGLVEGDYVSCPKHNSRFHIPTGKAMRIPARIALKTFPVRIEEGKVFIGLPA